MRLLRNFPKPRFVKPTIKVSSNEHVNHSTIENKTIPAGSKSVLKPIDNLVALESSLYPIKVPAYSSIETDQQPGTEDVIPKEDEDEKFSTVTIRSVNDLIQQAKRIVAYFESKAKQETKIKEN